MQEKRMPELRVISVSELSFIDRGWSRGYAHVALPETPPGTPGYIDFGPLLLFAAEEVDAGEGFAKHLHREIESLTIMLEGAFIHEDTTGERGRIGSSEVAVMSAGTGIEHSEWVEPPNKVRVVTIWLRPAVPGQPPQFVARGYPNEVRKNQLITVASGRNDAPAEALPIRQDASLLIAVLSTHGEVTYTLEPGRRTYMVGAQGAIEVNGRAANAGERVIASGSGILQVRALAPTELVVLDVV
jgi:quercetin 2,3-dioxygenase